MSDLLLAQTTQLWWLQHAPMAAFVFAFGACVGSFLNVVIYRLPEGMSVISPPSRCPSCKEKLRLFRDNLPILGFILVRAKCRYCGVKLSPQYMIIELLIALLFTYLYFVLYAPPSWLPTSFDIGGLFWTRTQLMGSWGRGAFGSFPAFIMLGFLLAGLIAMTVIDARTFTIPIQIPVFVTIVAFLFWPIQAILPGPRPAEMSWPIPGVDWDVLGFGVGGMVGVLIGWGLLRFGILRYSFHDYEDYVVEGETLAEYPHARREMGVEIVFLLPCLILAGVGYWLGSSIPATGSVPPEWAQAIGASFAGYLSGGGIVWAVRILGTLGFGREAMGLGDVHLLAAVGAVLGWFDPLLIFFCLAPFSGLLWAAVTMGIASMTHGARRELPYGPHLAVATFLLIFLHPVVESIWNTLFVQIPMPARGFLVAP